MRPFSSRVRRGFNLIEIAIVFAVIGLTLGGIYIAAAAITEQNRVLQLQKDIFVTAENVRMLFATQPEFQNMTYDQVKASGVMPGDLQDTGSTYLTNYGSRFEIWSNGGITSLFGIHVYTLPQSACIKLILRTFANGSTIQNMGFDSIHSDSGGSLPNWQDGVTPADAAGFCNSETNHLVFDFKIH